MAPAAPPAPTLRGLPPATITRVRAIPVYVNGIELEVVKVARLGEWFNVRTAWHGPADVSPVGHAANAHIDLAVWNFGIQEAVHFSPELQEIFPGCPEMQDGYLHVNEAPGLGVDVNETLAQRHPLPDENDYRWTQVRRRDGTLVRP